MVKKYLFICQHNFTRSKYGAEFFRGYLKGKKKKGEVSSAGIGFVSYFTGRRVNKKILKENDVIFVMEKYMEDYLVKEFKTDKNKIIVLGIKDNYGYFEKGSFDDLDKVFQRINWEKFIL